MRVIFKSIVILILFLQCVLIEAVSTVNIKAVNNTENGVTVFPSDISIIRQERLSLNTPTYDGSGQAVHPDIYYNANGWKGYKYWMVMTPYPNGNDAYENPSILVSNDGISWSVPPGLTNPIDPQPASGSNSDVDIVYNKMLDRLEIYYVESGAGTSYLMRKTSTDGIDWSPEMISMTLPDYQVMSPAIIKNGSKYDMWYTGGANCNSNTSVKYGTSADGISWSSPQIININSNLNIWHLDVSYIPSKNEYWMVYAAYPKGSTCGNTDLYFARSTDKYNWINYPDKIINRGTSWDSAQIYRSSFLFDETSNTIRMWYSARGGNNIWHIGYVEIDAPTPAPTPTPTPTPEPVTPGAPSLTAIPQESQVNDIVGANRTFSITANQTVNVTWYLNGVITKDSEKGVTSASYTNTSAAQGNWIVKATATNTNGTVSKEWIWDVAKNNAYYQTIFNADGSITFKNNNNGNVILTSSPQYSFNYCQGSNCFEITNGNINPTVVTKGNVTYITSIDDTNAFVKVTHYYELDTASPYITYTATLRYKQDVTVTGERFDFNVPDKVAQIMTRDMKLIPFDNLKTYWSDLYTPKVVKFNNGLYFIASDTMESMKLHTSATGSLVSFYSDFKENHPHFHYIRNGAGRIAYTSESIRTIDDTYSASVTFAINPSASPKTLIKTRQPYGYDAALTLTNHADNEMLARIEAVAYGTEDKTDPDHGTKGIAGRGIGWTKSVFVSGCSPPVNTDDCYQGADLQDTDFKAQTDRLYNDGVEIVGHTTMPEIESRSMVSDGLQTLSQYNTRNWIDHGASGGISNWEDLASQGAIKGDSNYVLDIFDQYDYKYAWSYIDLPTTSYSPNMLSPVKTEEVRPFFFYNNQVDNNVYDSKKLHLWSTVNTGIKPDLFYTNSNIDSLIAERGMHIGHEYLAYDPNNNHAWYVSSGITKIYPAFDSELAYIASKKENGLLWSPTMSALGDYLVSLKDISIIYNNDGTYNITNNGFLSVTGITLLAEDTIKSATINEQSLVSFGGSYGNNEIILPTLAPYQSVNLKITYGTKDSSIPTITSNDDGKIKVNEITGVWDNKIKQLIMTAQGTNVTRSFTVKIPDLANKIITVRDMTLGTTIGCYTASDSGEITFFAPLGALHTFRIGEFEELAGGPSIISFAPLTPTVNDYPGSTRSFNFTVNQTVNVTWYLNGAVIKDIEKNVIQASYINTSASIGIWNVSFVASNPKGTAVKTWIWNVTSQSPSDITSITVLPSDISIIRQERLLLNTPTYDGSGQAVHPDIYYNANGWKGYKYWMVMTPYPNGNDAYENPSIVVSNDGISWVVPPGLTNPVDPRPASGSNSDVDIVYSEMPDRLEIYYVESGAGTSNLMRRTSTDGIDWSPETISMTLTDYQVMSPSIIKNGSKYEMWYTGGASCNSNTSVKYSTSADGISWSSPQIININSNLNIWQMDVSYIPSKNEYWMVYAAYQKGSTCGNTDLYFARSADRVNWTDYPDIIVKRNASWDSSQIYRSTFLFDDTSNTIRMFYSARGGSAWHIGYVERQYFSALAKDQSGQTVDAPITWTCSNAYVGTITSGGLFEALSQGMTTITASSGAVSGTANVRVTDKSAPIPPSITSYTPASPVNDIAGATRIFSITASHNVNVTWYVNGTQVQFNKSVSDASYTNTSAALGTWIVNTTATNDNGNVSKEWVWIVNSSSTATPPSNSGGGSSSGGGGGGGSSGESYSNILLIEKYDLQISKDVLTSYKFTDQKNPIRFVNITGNTSYGIITTSVEVLKNTSTLVKTKPEGLVYKNVNIWAGTSGFATPRNIKEASIIFRVENSWLSLNSLTSSDIKLVRWDGSKWITIDTKVKEKDSANTYFEGKTSTFSQFAITGIKVKGGPAAGGPPHATEVTAPVAATNTSTITANLKEKASGLEVVPVIAAFLTLYIFIRKRR